MKKIVSVMLVCVLVLGILPFASAEVGRVTPARCPACSDALIYRTYTVDFGHRTVTYRQASCPQHGDVYGAEELSAEVRHNWSGDGDAARCGDCGLMSEDELCPKATTFHRWMTDYRNGAARCVMCGQYDVGNADEVCPNHTVFHCWTTDYRTGGVICTQCGTTSAVKVVD